MKRLILLLVVAFAIVVNTDAQGWLNRLKDKAKSKIENKIDDAVDNAMDKGIDKAEDEATDAVKGKKERIRSRRTKILTMSRRLIPLQLHHPTSSAALSSCSKMM